MTFPHRYEFHLREEGKRNRLLLEVAVPRWVGWVGWGGGGLGSAGSYDSKFLQ